MIIDDRGEEDSEHISPELDSKLKHSYKQAIAGEGSSVDDVFDRIEQRRSKGPRVRSMICETS